MAANPDLFLKHLKKRNNKHIFCIKKDNMDEREKEPIY